MGPRSVHWSANTFGATSGTQPPYYCGDRVSHPRLLTIAHTGNQVILNGTGGLAGANFIGF